MTKSAHLLSDSEPAPRGVALESALARLEDSREQLTRAWLQRVCRRASLEQIERMPTDRMVAEVSQLVVAVARALRRGEGAPTVDLDGERVLAARLAALRGGRSLGASDLARDLADLQSEVIAALHRGLGLTEPRLFGQVVERLAAIFGALQATAAEELVSTRSRELEQLASTDPLTGLYNLRFLRQHTGHLIEVHQRYGDPFALLALDVDDLKAINDSYGHAAGDQVLQAVAQTIREGVRAVDRPVRMGGDEFCVLAAHQTANEGHALAERLGTAIEQAETRERLSIGVSIGVVSCPEHGLDVERLLELADRAMYRAKGAGQRVAVGVAEDLPMEAGAHASG